MNEKERNPSAEKPEGFFLLSVRKFVVKTLSGYLIFISSF